MSPFLKRYRQCSGRSQIIREAKLLDWKICKYLDLTNKVAYVYKEHSLGDLIARTKVGN